jgi:hypothetical protein
MRVKAKKLYAAIALALAAMLVASTAAIAAVTYDPATGGFAGKGDVQQALGLNNAQLQAQAGSLQFTYKAITERSWVCTNERNENTQVRERTTTTTQVVSAVARERNQITGFNLQPLDPAAPPLSQETEGPPVNSCPSGPWTLTQPAGDPVPVEGGGLFVNGVPLQ